MALSKTFIQDNGISTSYHKVSKALVRTDTNDGLNLRVYVTSYLNEAYRKNEQPIETSIYSFNISDEQESETSIRKLAYNQLKTLGNWADAVDC